MHFRQRLRKEHLLNGEIDSDKLAPLIDRQAYAWAVYNSTKSKYTTNHKEAAFQFLIRTLGINTIGATTDDIIRSINEHLQHLSSSFDTESMTSLEHNRTLQDHAAHCSNDIEKIKSALQIYVQMATILYQIQVEGYVVSEMDNTNWLVDDHEQLRIANRHPFEQAKSHHDSTTPTRLTPSVDKMHLRLLGKNIYQYLTKCSSSYLAQVSDASPFNFNAPLFKTEQGALLKKLIVAMVNSPSPYERMTMDSAVVKLKQLQMLPLQNECRHILANMITKNTANDDPTLNDFFLAKQNTIDQANIEATLIDLKTELNIISSQLENDQTMHAIRAKILEIKTSLAMTTGIQTKLNKLSTEVNQIPIIKRQNDSEMELRLLHTISSLPADAQLYKESFDFLTKLQPTFPKKYGAYFKQKQLEIFNAEHLIDLTTFKHSVRYDIAKSECLAMLNEIKRYTFGDNDEEMSEYVRQKQNEIDAANDLSAINPLLAKLHTTLFEASNNIVLMKIRKTINEFRNNAFFYTIGMNAKANKIEQVMANVPVEERQHIMKGQTLATIAVQKALASHRHFWKQGQEINNDGSINEQKAATSFKTIKARFFASTNSATTIEPIIAAATTLLSK